MKKLLLLSLLLQQSIYSFCQTPADFINPFIGTTNKGNTHPGAVRPWGLVSVSPHTVNTPRGAFYYEYGAPHIYGFGHVQLSGVGCGEAGNIVLMPFSEKGFSFDAEKRKSTYRNEKAKAGFYSCYLEQPAVAVKATATLRTGRTQFTYTGAEGGLVLDLAMSKSTVKGGYLRKISETEIEGWQWAGKFCDMPLKRKVFFVLRVKAPRSEIQLYQDSVLSSANTVEGSDVVCVIKGFGEKELGLETAVGISFVSIDNARLNLEKEQGNKNFEQLSKEAFQSWNKELSTIKVAGSNEDDRVKFYSAYYHTLLSPVVFNDVNGDYISMQTDTAKERTKQKTNKDHYSVYSLWDTYRTVHPFLTLFHPAQQENMVGSMLKMYQQGGWLPKWELYGQESWVMVGDPAPIVIADSYLKGIKNFDTALAWKAMKKGSLQTVPQNMLRPGNAAYWEHGYVPIDQRGGTDSTLFSWTNGYVWGPVSTSLEYHLADFNIGAFANAIGCKKESETWLQQSNRFHLLFDTATKMFRPRLANGRWLTPFDPKDREFDIRWKNSGGHGYVEGDAWIYRFFAIHNIQAVIDLYGSKKAFTDSLQKMFDEGHFDMSNEPDITYPYLFNYVKGEEWRTQKIVKESIEKYFTPTPGGIPGNDDAGTMSAWLLFSMMGIFPDCPGIPLYQITTPTFNEISIKLSQSHYKGKSFTIRKRGTGNRIKKITLNGKRLTGYTISHQQIVNGGSLLVEVE